MKQKVREFKEKALAFNIEIDDVNEEAANYGSQGALLQWFCKYIKARDYMETGEKEGAVATYAKLGLCFQSLGKHDMAA